MAYTSQDLLDAIARRSFAPDNQSTFSSAEILAIADEATQTVILPAIMSVREEYFVTSTDYTVENGKASYPIPDRAIGLAVREVRLRDASGRLWDIPRIDPDRAYSTTSSKPCSYYVKGNNIVLYPTPDSTDLTLQVDFPMHPGTLILPTDAAKISEIDTATNTITVATMPSTWTTGVVLDFIKGTGGQETRSIDNTSTDITGTSIQFSSIPSTLTVGDYVALAGETPLVQLPTEYRTCLSQATAAHILQAMNQPGSDTAWKQLQGMMEAAQKLITPRTQGDANYLISPWW